MDINVDLTRLYSYLSLLGLFVNSVQQGSSLFNIINIKKINPQCPCFPNPTLSTQRAQIGAVRTGGVASRALRTLRSTRR